MKIAKLPDRTPVKITFVASPSLAKSLALYTQYYEEVYRQAESILELMPYVLEAFLESDRGFMKFCRGREVGATTNTDQASTTGARRLLLKRTQNNRRIAVLGAVWREVAKEGNSQDFLGGTIDFPGLDEPIGLTVFFSEDGAKARALWRRRSPHSADGADGT